MERIGTQGLVKAIMDTRPELAGSFSAEPWFVPLPRVAVDAALLFFGAAIQKGLSTCNVSYPWLVNEMRAGEITMCIAGEGLEAEWCACIKDGFIYMVAGLPGRRARAKDEKTRELLYAWCREQGWVQIRTGASTAAKRRLWLRAGLKEHKGLLRKIL